MLSGLACHAWVGGGHDEGVSASEPAFERFFVEHWGAVCAYVARRADVAVVEDVAAEVFAVAWRRWDSVPADARPWLLGVARRVLANERRATARRSRLAERVAREPVAPIVETDETIAAGARTAEVRAALGRLGSSDREVLMLVHWDGLDAGGAARVLGCSALAARARLSRARKRLRAELDRPALKTLLPSEDQC
jgi:RNA polymerase sigma factor (sigma-70 family)